MPELSRKSRSKGLLGVKIVNAFTTRSSALVKMLRSIRRKLAGSTSIQRFRYTSSASARSQVRHVEDIVSVPYGQEYGAGPSRLPYDAVSAGKSSNKGITSHAIRRETIVRARKLRQILADSSTTGQYARPDIFDRYIHDRHSIGCINHMSRLEFHTVLNHLIRVNRPTLGLSLIESFIKHGQRPDIRVRRIISIRTLRKLLQVEAALSFSDKSTKVKLPILLDLLRALQSVRHHRPVQLYFLLVNMAVHARKPDKAAEIYVGLVEEWVTEGRVAEGADVEGFYEGGGPPRTMSDNIAKKHKSWWKGVRSWTLPGEVLSPHDRLDLWHPAKLAIGMKFKNFPYPLATSPPSMVPAPSGRLLHPILSSLRLDPSVAAPEDFRASMRACAILGNTILSRTLPLSSLGPLLRALEATPSHPPVYPAGMIPPKEDAWAYQAFTHVHLALQSFFFSPPISSSSFAEARANETVLSGSPPTTHAHKYRLQPLAFGDTVILVRYALEKMRMPKILGKLVGYMKRCLTYGWQKPTIWNTLFKGATVLGDKQLAQVADEALFGKTLLSRAESEKKPEEGVIVLKPRADERLVQTETDRSTAEMSARIATILTPDASLSIQADESSLVTLINHLGKTSQFSRLEDIIYKLIPFLSDSKADRNPDHPGLSGHDHSDIETGVSGRQTPVYLTPNLYSAILSSLALSGKTGLAQRVFVLAKSAEKSWIGEYFERHPPHDGNSPDIPFSLRLPIPIFSAMLRIWANERPRSTVTGLVPGQGGSAGINGTYPIGWIPPRKLAGQPRHIAAGLMARTTYLAAASRFPFPGTGTDLSGPDEVFFDNALQALSFHLGFQKSVDYLPPKVTELLQKVVMDMRTFGVSVPPAVMFRYEVSLSQDTLDRLSYGEKYATALRPRDYRVYWPVHGLKERLGRAERLRKLAEGMLRADEEGLWRDKEDQESDGRRRTGGGGRWEGKAEEEEEEEEGRRVYG